MGTQLSLRSQDNIWYLNWISCLLGAWCWFVLLQYCRIGGMIELSRLQMWNWVIWGEWDVFLVKEMWQLSLIVSSLWLFGTFIGTDLLFSNFLNFYSSLGIDHDPPCSHDLCLLLFLMFHSSHEYTAKRSCYRIMIFYRLRSSILWTHPYPHFLLLPPQPHHPYTPHLRRSTTVPLGEGYHLAVRYDYLRDHDCTWEDSPRSRLDTAKVKWVLPSRKSIQRDGQHCWEPLPD